MAVARRQGRDIGLEIDFGYSPNFFGLSDDSDFNLTGDGNVTTLTGNLLIGPSVGRVRPYVVGGIGLIRSKVDNTGGFFDKVSTNDFGFDAGAGIVGLFSDKVGCVAIFVSSDRCGMRIPTVSTSRWEASNSGGERSGSRSSSDQTDQPTDNSHLCVSAGAAATASG